jgi:hypothetical protein
MKILTVELVKLIPVLLIFTQRDANNENNLQIQFMGEIKRILMSKEAIHAATAVFWTVPSKYSFPLRKDLIS